MNAGNPASAQLNEIEQRLWAEVYAKAFIAPKGEWASVERWNGEAEKIAQRAADQAVMQLRERAGG